MFAIYEENRDKIRMTMREGNWKESIELCTNYKKQLDSCGYLMIGDALEEYWFVIYNKGLSCKKDGNLADAYKLAKESIKYTQCDIFDYKFTQACWLIGESAFELGYSNESKESFKICCKAYRLKKDSKYRLISLFNLAKAKKDTRSMLRIIRIYEKNNPKQSAPNYGDMQKDDILFEMCTNLFNLYASTGDNFNMFKTLKVIRDKEIKEELKRYLVA